MSRQETDIVHTVFPNFGFQSSGTQNSKKKNACGFGASQIHTMRSYQENGVIISKKNMKK